MRRQPVVFLISLLLFSCVSFAFAEERSLTFVIGAMGSEPSRQAAHNAAETARRWLRTTGAQAQILKAGAQEATPLDAGLSAEQLDKLFLDAVEGAHTAAPAEVLTALDAAAQALAVRPGLRVVVSMAGAPPLSLEAEQSLERLLQYCREKGVRVVVLDPAAIPTKGSTNAFERFAQRTGGSWLTKSGALESAVLMLAPAETEPPKTETAKAAPAPAESEGAFRIPIHTRFVRAGNLTALGGAVGQSSETPAHASVNDPGTVLMNESGLGPNESGGPLRGQVMLETPLNALKFEQDDHAGTYLARVRITQMVRNEKGNPVWQAQKELDLRGPIRKLEERRRGSLYLVRSVTVPAGVYTLEASVEDLISHSQGSISEPLRTSTGVRGLNASDAMFVRRFRSGGDRLESDQIFAYDGEALSPILAPEFKEDEPVDLSIFLTIYPDIRSAQPEMSFELLRQGRVVGRLPLPFKTWINNNALDGKSVSMIGGRAKSFPYLAVMKGARLGAGDFEARITIRQGRNVLTRSVPFHVQGNPAAADATASSMGGPAPDDLSGIVMPVVDTATLQAGSIAPPLDEQKRLWEEAGANAKGYSSGLPHFRCNQETHRLRGPAKEPDQIRPADTYVDELTYEDGKETYVALQVNGEKADPNQARGGVSSTGEFASMMGAIFNPEIGAKYKWAGRAMAGGVLCQVFEIEVPKKTSNFTMRHKNRAAAAAYTGRVYIDEDTRLVRRITIEGSGLPKDFLLQSPSMSLDYAMVRIGSQDYLLPLRSVLQVLEGRTIVRNETVFRDYRKFEAASAIQFNK